MTGQFRLIPTLFLLMTWLGAGVSAGEKPPASGKTPTSDSPAKGEFPISPGQMVQESLSSGDDQFQDDTYYDQYNLNWPGGDLTVTYSSTAYDEYLVVWEPPGFPDGVRVDVDEFLTSPEVYSKTDAPAGMYTIWTNSYEPATGAYSLSVSESSVVVCPTPAPPSNPSPADQATGVPVDVDLLWTGKSQSKVIYGTDDRLDVYQVTNPDLLNIARSVVALVDLSEITPNQDGTFTLSNATFNDYIVGLNGLPLCQNEPYRLQPVPGRCSGFLVGPDLVMTAGHCVDNQGECDEAAFVFGFDMLDANTPKLTFEASDIYYCDGIVQRVFTENGADWALIRLDRPVVGRDPLPIRRSGKIANNQSLVLMGHPVGLPKKIAGNANVRTNDAAAFFTANLDSFTANSGSPVLNAQTLEVEGILVRGNSDFQLNGNCYESIECSNSGCQGEDCTRTTEFAQFIPQVESQTYTVLFGPCGALAEVGNPLDPAWDLPVLQPGTTYCWQIRTKNDCGEMRDGPVWTFTTEGATPTPTPTQPGETPVPTALNPAADVNRDGAIDALDMIEVLENWHRIVVN